MNIQSSPVKYRRPIQYELIFNDETVGPVMVQGLPEVIDAARRRSARFPTIKVVGLDDRAAEWIAEWVANIARKDDDDKREFKIRAEGSDGIMVVNIHQALAINGSIRMTSAILDTLG